jgi:hypothetical protein
MIEPVRDRRLLSEEELEASAVVANNARTANAVLTA